jgi:RNA polymerase sigma factor (sigma-70 family)
MTDAPALTDLLGRLRRGEAGAADEFVRHYGPAVRIAVRTRLTDPQLRRQFDSEDVCQSVFASFLARTALGELTPDDTAGLIRILVRMAIRKVGRRARNLRRLRRDYRREVPGGDEIVRKAPAAEAPPDQLAAGRDLVEAVRTNLGVDDRRLADLRAEGLSWAEVARRAGGTPEARRKQLRRALDEVLHTLGVEDGSWT